MNKKYDGIGETHRKTKLLLRTIKLPCIRIYILLSYLKVWLKFLLRIILLILPLILTIPSIIYISDNTLVLFPNPGYSNQIEASTSPNSSIENFLIDSKRIAFSYILKEEPGGMPMPYSSLVIWLTRENTFFDLSGYDYLSLEIEKATTGKVVIFIKTFEKGVSKPEKFEGITLRHNEFTLSITPGISGYNIHINDFLTPDWWFSLMHVPWDKRFKESFKHVSALDFQFIHRSDDPPDGKVQSFIVRNIAFHKSYPFYYIILNIITVLYCILIAASLVINRRSSPSQHHYWDSIMMKIMGLIKEYKVPPLKKLQYRQRELENYADNELTRIMKYLEEHYPDPEISTTLISAETGIPRSHITELIRSEYDCSCRQLINRIRITEAKRLLKTTDRRILEIALEVGFNDISTFNRCFKHGEGISPRQYRARR